MKLQHIELSLPTQGAWLAARLAHAHDAHGIALMLRVADNPLIRQREHIVATVLQEAGLATLALDLVPHAEARHDIDAFYNIARLSSRILATVEWIGNQPILTGLAVGALATSTASAAVIRAATHAPERFGALCLFAGRPDLAGKTPLRTLKSPSRFIVGADDGRAAILRQAFDLIPATRDWQTIEGGEPEHFSIAALTTSATLAADWLLTHLRPPCPAVPEQDAGE
ncbi:MAG: alpha/beta hydrolase [Azoarcus sp.]|jgi:hypothetical protein|nr:alpha/beta hydrolase [Azoarcus sp.]